MLHEKKCTLQPCTYFQLLSIQYIFSLLLTKLIAKLDQEWCVALWLLIETENGVLYSVVQIFLVERLKNGYKNTNNNV